MIEYNENNVTAKIVTASEKLVDYLLSLNTENRPIKKTVVDKYARDLQDNNWYLTNQGIGIYEDNVLADGQHRLHAIKRTKRFDQKILLVEGLQRNALKGIDQHAKRNHRDLARMILGVALNNRSIAMSNIIFKMKYMGINAKKSSFVNPTFNETQELLEFYLDQFNVLNAANKKNFIAASILAPFVVKHKLCSKEDKYKIESFIQKVANGEMLQKGSNEYTLFNYIIHGKKMSGGSELQIERFLKGYAICLALLNNLNVTKMIVSDKTKQVVLNDFINTENMLKNNNSTTENSD